MSTIAYKQIGTKSLTNARSTDHTKNMKEFWGMMEFNRFGVVAWTLAIVACFSGVVAGFFVDGTNQFEITVAAASTVATLVSILAVAPVRWILGVGAAAILINILLMIF